MCQRVYPKNNCSLAQPWRLPDLRIRSSFSEVWFIFLLLSNLPCSAGTSGNPWQLTAEKQKIFLGSWSGSVTFMMNGGLPQVAVSRETAPGARQSVTGTEQQTGKVQSLRPLTWHFSQLTWQQGRSSGEVTRRFVYQGSVGPGTTRVIGCEVCVCVSPRLFTLPSRVHMLGHVDTINGTCLEEVNFSELCLCLRWTNMLIKKTWKQKA